MTDTWQSDYTAFKRRDMKQQYVYLWADGVLFNVRLEEDRLYTLVLIGARADGQKEVIAVEDGYRESKESWASLLRDLSQRGMATPMCQATLKVDPQTSLKLTPLLSTGVVVYSE